MHAPWLAGCPIIFFIEMDIIITNLIQLEYSDVRDLSGFTAL
jgi:hypothetical protein